MKLENIKNICVKCKALCCKLGGPTVTKKERDKILKEGFKDYFVKVGKFYDLKAKNGICLYLKNHLCTIQKIKPILCKTHPVFPFWRGKKERYIVLDCPLTQYLSKKDIQNLKRMASKITRELMTATLTGEIPPIVAKRWKKFHYDKKVKEVFGGAP